MGLYGSPQLGVFGETPKSKKRSSPILIIIDAVALFITLSFILAIICVEFNLSIYVNSASIFIIYGLIVGLTVGFFKKIRHNVSNWKLFLFLLFLIVINLIIFNLPLI